MQLIFVDDLVTLPFSTTIENKLNAFAVHPQLFNQNRENFKSDLENYDDLKECDSNKKILKRRELNFSPKGYFTSKQPFLNC